MKFPFSSARKRMSVIINYKNENMILNVSISEETNSFYIVFSDLSYSPPYRIENLTKSKFKIHMSISNYPYPYVLAFPLQYIEFQGLIQVGKCPVYGLRRHTYCISQYFEKTKTKTCVQLFLPVYYRGQCTVECFPNKVERSKISQHFSLMNSSVKNAPLQLLPSWKHQFP